MPSGPDYSYTLVNPVSIQKRNAAGTRSESIAATRASTAGKLSAFDSFAQSSYVRWSVTLANTLGQTTAIRRYHTIPSSGDGSSGTNYDETTYGYDAYSRRNKVKTPGGTITRTVFDAFGRAACTYVGTDDSGATDSDPSSGRESCSSGSYGPSSSSSSSSSANPNNNMVLVTENIYAGAGGCSGCGGGGSGLLVQTNQFVDAQSYRVTELLYDWRNRQEFVLADADDQGRFTFGRSHYDNLDRVVKAERYHDVHGDGPDPDGGIHPDDVLLARSESFYDDRGQVYLTKTYAVDPATGTVGSALAGYAWRDAAGSPIKQQPPGSKLFAKTTYDSLGRVYETFAGHDLSEPLPRALGESSSSSSSSSGPTSYDCATNVDGDTILEQARTDYDAAGNALLSTLWRRLHNATGTGRLNDPAGSQPRGRRSYAASWYDPIGRQVASANYGTNAGSSLTRPDAVPARSDTVLVNSTSYNSAGQAETATNPAGITTKLEYDQAGRVIKQIANYVAGSSSSSSSGGCPAPDDVNVTLQTAYNADGNVSSITAVNSSTGNQVTQYIYGTTLSDSAIASSLLKRAEVYPDSADSTDRIEFKYNRQGEVTEVKDQAGTVHAFDFDKLGRKTQDRVTTLGTGVDGAIRRIASTYEVRGMREKATSYDNPNVGSGSVDNEAKFSYNSFAQLTTEYQEHGGAVNTSTSPKVQYGYASGGESTIRPTQLAYPNGRVLNFNYGASGSTGDAINRVAALLDNDGSSHLVDYSYLGLGLPLPLGEGRGEGGFVKADYAEPDIRWDLAFGTGNDPHDGLDRFDRVVDNRWLNYGTSTDVDRIQYGYDRNGSRTYREQTCDSNSNFDEVYGYDLIDRLKTMDRGPLNAQKNGVTSLKFAQCWGLDSTGNWRDFREDADGAGGWDLIQQRSHNAVNEVSDITETVGSMWITPQYDRAGNMTRVPKPSDPTAYFTCTYDAWNRLVKVIDGQSTVAEYRYDGAKRRIVKKTYTGGQVSETRHFYYTEPSKWQVIEERVGASSYADRQFVWGLRYIDDLVLRDRNADGNSNTGNLGKTGSGLEERLYALQDANWNVTALCNTSGSIQERYGYSAYGTPLYMTASFGSRSTSSYAWETLYAGYPWDAEVQMNYVRNRVLAPSVGWLQRDPINYELEEYNLYRYVGNGPLTKVDPSGNGDSVTRAIQECLTRPTLAAQLACLDSIGADAGHALLDEAKRRVQRAIKCEAVYAAYKAAESGISSCTATMTLPQLIAAHARAAAGVAGRLQYLNLKCDYCLPGSIAANSKTQEAAHRAELAPRIAAVANCIALIAAKRKSR